MEAQNSSTLYDVEVSAESQCLAPTGPSTLLEYPADHPILSAPVGSEDSQPDNVRRWKLEEDEILRDSKRKKLGSEATKCLLKDRSVSAIISRWNRLQRNEQIAESRKQSAFE